MSKCIEKLPCEKCGSGDALQVFKEDGEGYTGWCFSCSTYYPDPYKDKPEGYKPNVQTRNVEDVLREIEEVRGYPYLEAKDRGLREATLAYFGVKTGVSEYDGVTPSFHYFPYSKDGKLCAYKVRFLLRKQMWGLGSLKGADFFGWEQALQSGGKKLFITEGEYDAMALYQILKDSNRHTKWADLDPAVVSLPYGASGAKNSISKVLPKILKRWEEIIFVPDMDEAGQRAAEEVSKLDSSIKVAHLPCKDVNECLLEGREKAAKAAVMFNAVRKKNTSIIRGSSLRTAAKARPSYGISWPWEGMTNATRGIRRQETYYFGAGVKMGKSEVVNAIGAHLIVEHGLPIFLAKPEEQPFKTYQRLVGKAASRIFHDPNIPFDEEAFDKAEPLIGDLALIQDVYQFVDWDNLKGDIKYAVSEGVKDVFIDPITCLTNTLTSGEANDFLVNAAAELSAMAKDLDFTAYIFCHLKAPNSGEPHERGGKVLSNQFAGSRAMMRSCNYMIGMEGNKDPDLSIEEKNIRDLVIIEDREFGCSDRIKLYWDFKTGAFNEIRG